MCTSLIKNHISCTQNPVYNEDNHLQLLQSRTHALWDALLPDLLKLPQVELDSIMQQHQRRAPTHSVLI